MRIDPRAAPTDPSPGSPEHVRIAVIGAGFSGIGAAVALAGAGHEVIVLERAATIGGTWRDNAYPGCACDVPSHLYSFSFAPNPGWSTRYSRQPEILSYLADVAERSGVVDRIRCGVDVRSASWDDAARRWRLRTSRADLTADVLVAATGPLSAPHLPELPGLTDFGGPVLHTGRWSPATDLTGRRVAVIGTGASAVQLVPKLAGRAASVTVFQRTPPWILPRRDRVITGRQRERFGRHPLLQRLARWRSFTERELAVVGLVHTPSLLRVVEDACRRHLRDQVPDPGLRELLTPEYRAGCKRILLSDDYYPSLLRDDVELVAQAAVRLEPGAVIGADGSRREADAVVFATGFEPTEPPIARLLTGRDGRVLADVWARSGMQAHRGITVHGFPNLFFLIGPNTGVGHTSMVQIIESQLTYLLDALSALDRRRLASVEPTSDAQRAWNDRVQRRLGRSVWVTGGCSSWYQDSFGRITTLWPGSTLRYRWETRRIDLLEYRITPRAGRPAGHTPEPPLAAATGGPR